jgi:hypothetical protein
MSHSLFLNIATSNAPSSRGPHPWNFTKPLDHADEDSNPTRTLLFDWSPTLMLWMADNAAKVIFWLCISWKLISC